MKKLISKLFKKNKKSGRKETLKIAVFTENMFEQERFFKLFNFMLSDRVEKVIRTRDRAEIYADDIHIIFLRKSMSVRGHRANYVINLTQDKDFHNMVARPIEAIGTHYLKDPKFKDLF